MISLLTGLDHASSLAKNLALPKRSRFVESTFSYFVIHPTRIINARMMMQRIANVMA